MPGIRQTDDVLVWAGGIYDWFDPLTLIRAVHGLAKRRPSVRLYFMGLHHPNPDVPPMQMAIDARALAEELGLAGRMSFSTTAGSTTPSARTSCSKPTWV